MDAVILTVLIIGIILLILSIIVLYLWVSGRISSLHGGGLIVILVILWFLYLYIFGLWSYTANYLSDLTVLDDNYLFKTRVSSRDRVVISLTTIPSRIYAIQDTLKSLLRQSHRVDDIYIWLPKKTLKGGTYQIPKFLKRLKNVHIKRVKRDYGPATKLVYALMTESPNTKIIVVDDDMVYPVDTVKKLVHASNRKPTAAITGIGFDMNPLSAVAKTSDFVDYNYRRVGQLMGMSGFLVKPKFFFPHGVRFKYDCLDYSKAPEEVVWVDDIWFSGHLAYNNVPIYRLPIGLLNVPLESPSHTSMKKKVALRTDHNYDHHTYRQTYQYFKSLGVYS